MFILVIKIEKKAEKGKDYPRFQNNILPSTTAVKHNMHKFRARKRAKIYYVDAIQDVNWAPRFL